MFNSEQVDQLEQFRYAIGRRLANLSQWQRWLGVPFVLAIVFVVVIMESGVGFAVIVVGALSAIVQWSERAVVSVPDPKQRVGENLVARVQVPLDALCAVVGGTRGDEQNRAIVAMFNVFELYGGPGEVTLDLNTLNRLGNIGDLPSLTKAELSAISGLTFCENSRSEDIDGRHFDTTVVTKDGSTVGVRWTVWGVPGRHHKCVHRIDDVTLDV